MCDLHFSSSEKLYEIFFWVRSSPPIFRSTNLKNSNKWVTRRTKGLKQIISQHLLHMDNESPKINNRIRGEKNIKGTAKIHININLGRRNLVHNTAKKCTSPQLYFKAIKKAKINTKNHETSNCRSIHIGLSRDDHHSLFIRFRYLNYGALNVNSIKWSLVKKYYLFRKI